MRCTQRLEVSWALVLSISLGSALALAARGALAVSPGAKQVAYDLFYDVLTPQERLDCGRKMVQYLRSKAGPYMYPELGFHGGGRTKLLIAMGAGSKRPRSTPA